MSNTKYKNRTSGQAQRQRLMQDIEKQLIKYEYPIDAYALSNAIAYDVNMSAKTVRKYLSVLMTIGKLVRCDVFSDKVKLPEETKK